MEIPSQQISQTILSAMPLAAAILADDGMIVSFNAQMSEMFGMSLAGEHLHLLMRAPAVLEAFEAAKTNNQQSNARNVARSATSRTIDVTFSPMQLGSNSKRHFLTTCVDATREQLIEKMRSDFVANASHELRTPLTSLSGFIETMQGAASKDEKARGEFLKLMKAQADRMSHLIDDLLSLSRIELDEHVAPREVVNLAGVVEQARNLLQTLADENGSHLTINMPMLLNVKGDSRQLGQVIHNLIENAVKYAGRGKEISVTGQLEEDTVILRVADNGPGIAAHHIPRLTERFYRANVQDSRTRGGTGLGLAICKHIINRHRGRLLIESVLGEGSTFTVQLPSTE